MKRKITIMILCVLMVCIGIATQSGAGETYDLNGEWNAVYNSPIFGITKDTMTITQEGNKFVGIRSIGSTSVPKGEEAVKGEISNRMIDTVAMRYQKDFPISFDLSWCEGRGVITEAGGKMVIQSFMETASGNFFVTLTLTKK